MNSKKRSINNKMPKRHDPFTKTGNPFLSWLCTVALLTSYWISANAHAAAFDAEVAVTDDDNVTQAELDSDIKEDQFVSFAFSVSALKSFNVNRRLVYRGFLNARGYDKYDGLSNLEVGGQVTYQYRGSGAFTEPTLGAFIKGAIADYDSDLRDSDLLSLGVSWRKPFTDRITYTAILAAKWRDSDSTVFDTEELSLLQNADYILSRRWTLYLTYDYRDGDIVSTGAPSLRIVGVADEINADDAFGGAAANIFAYRLDAQTDVFTLGTNYRISEKHSLDISGRWIDSSADDGISYDRQQLSLAYLARF
ncbi:MAG: hypothetical protein E2O37_08130 [Proteobacteria bacterium]|nr:MAG: hypothetical protein E2O37_08130 [Pseudomonadota bacterium]